MTMRSRFGAGGPTLPGIAAAALAVLGVGCSGGLVQDPRGASPIEGGAAAAVAASIGAEGRAALAKPRERLWG